MIVDRRQLRDELARLLALLTRQPAPAPDARSPRARANARGRDRARPTLAALARVSRDAASEGDRARARPRARGARAACDAPIACPVVTVDRHQRQGLDVRDAGSDAALRRLSRRASTRRRTCCATTSACASTASDADDAALVAAFNAVEDARMRRPPCRSRISSSARWPRCALFARARLDALILEVGLGGRLDAVNIVDADVAVVDEHRSRSHRLPRPDARGHRPREGRHLSRRAARRSARDPIRRAAWSTTRARSARRCCALGRDFGYVARAARSGATRARAASASACRIPALRGAYQLANAADGARGARSACSDRLPVTRRRDPRGLCAVELPGRFQVLPGRPDDRARRRAQSACGARARATPRRSMGYPSGDDRGVRHARRQGHRRRDRRGASARIDRWFVASLPGPRGATRRALRDALARGGRRAVGDPRVRRRRRARIAAARGRGGRG